MKIIILLISFIFLAMSANAKNFDSKIVDIDENKEIINYEDIPHFHQTSVEGHQGRLIVGTVRGMPVVTLQGRIQHL